MDGINLTRYRSQPIAAGILLAWFWLCALVGCQSTGVPRPHTVQRVATEAEAVPDFVLAEFPETESGTASASGAESEEPPEIDWADTPDEESVAEDVASSELPVKLISSSEEVTSEDAITAVSLEQVMISVLQHYPLVRAAYQERLVADGNQLSAWGEFDTKLKAMSENQPLGFYETYRNSAGVTQPLYGGGEVFGGYRNGDGSFEPWYRERETNEGGEFKGGVLMPILRDRTIDSRRAEVWRRTYDQQLANPFIRTSLIQFAANASQAYWKWVATGHKYQLGLQWLDLASKRHERIELRVKEGDLAPPEETDNLRAIAKRKAKLANSRRELEQAALKLSLFLRDTSGRPYVPQLSELPEFPELRDIRTEELGSDISRARSTRPQLQAINLKLQQLRIDYAEACNMTRPRLDARLTGSQDMGQPTSSKRDKSEFELEAGVYFEFQPQQRKGRGKAHAVQAKMAQITAKRQLVSDKVEAEVRSAYAGLTRSREEAQQANRAADLAAQVANIERRKFEEGESDLLKVAIREQYALEAAEDEVSAILNHFSAFADYAAALNIQQPSTAILAAE